VKKWKTVKEKYITVAELILLYVKKMFTHTVIHTNTIKIYNCLCK